MFRHNAPAKTEALLPSQNGRGGERPRAPLPFSAGAVGTPRWSRPAQGRGPRAEGRRGAGGAPEGDRVPRPRPAQGKGPAWSGGAPEGDRVPRPRPVQARGREFDVKFKHPFNLLCTGPSQSGKSCFVKTLLHKREIEPYPSKVILATRSGSLYTTR